MNKGLARPWWRLRWLSSPAARIAAGLVSLMVGLLLLVEFFVGFPPDRLESTRREREQIATDVGVRIAQAIDGQGGEVQAAPRVLREVRLRTPELRSIALLSRDGQPLAMAGDHSAHWQLGRDAPSTLDNLRVPLRSRQQPWGEVQLAFDPASPITFTEWMRDPSLQRLLLLMGLGVGVFWLYLRRMLRYLDPNAAVPERVRDAFNTLSEGVLVLDSAGQVVLANHAFCALRGDDPKTLTGMLVRQMDWLRSALNGRQAPWTQAMSRRERISGLALSIQAVDGPRQLVLNCAPILDGRRLRGCLLSFADVTELHERTERLRETLEDLNRTQAEVERKNAELVLLASRDALTGLFNRRLLMEQAAQAVAHARGNGAPLACIMCDIDHFKSVNDTYGHAGGDQIIQGAARWLQQGLTATDFAGRYGGEEFCVLLPGRDRTEAQLVAEGIRAQMETHLGAELRDHTGARVTMSFGVAQLGPEVTDHAALIDRADQALYHAKKSGRNRVSVWPVPALGG